MHGPLRRSRERANLCVAFRATPGVRDQLRRVVPLARALEPNLRVSDVVHRAIYNLGVSVRQQLRTRGIDPSSIVPCPTARPTPKPGFDGITCRSMQRPGRRPLPWKGPTWKRPDPTEYDH